MPLDDFAPAAHPPRHLRRAYLASLSEAQELYLEERVQAGQTWSFDQGYAVIHDQTLVEFYPGTHRIQAQHDRLQTILDSGLASQILCKSFDHVLLRTALHKPASVRTTGLLYRRIHHPEFAPRSDVGLRPGEPDDQAIIDAFNEDFFHSGAEIDAYIRNRALYVLTEQEKVIGCGIITPVIDKDLHVDLGMLVAPHARQRGFGAYIIAFLKDQVLRRGQLPICGCSIDNAYSARALERAGFVCEHLLLEIQPHSPR